MNANLSISELLAKAAEASTRGDVALAKDSLEQALRQAPDDIAVLSQAAHSYSTALRDPVKGREYAKHARERAATIVAEMDELLARHSGSKPKNPATRHIGGIIGPY
jgi:hypothetical protein